MKLFARKRSLTQAWKYRADGEIWRIYPTGTDLLFGEDRETGTKKTGFFSLNRHTGDRYWSGEKVHEWWVGVEGVIGETLFLHGFATPDMPMHRGIVAINGRTGEQVWENPDLCFEYGTNNSVIASSGAAGSKTLFMLEAGTGDVVTEWKEGLDVGPDAPDVFPEQTIRYPELLTDPDQSKFREYLPSFSGPSSIIEESGYSIVACRDKPVGEQRILIFDSGTGEELYRNRITSEEGLFIPDSFLVQESMLYFVKDRKELIAVKLPSEGK